VYTHMNGEAKGKWLTRKHFGRDHQQDTSGSTKFKKKGGDSRFIAGWRGNGGSTENPTLAGGPARSWVPAHETQSGGGGGGHRLLKTARGKRGRVRGLGLIVESKTRRRERTNKLKLSQRD